jgi:hypothetical protein
MAQTGHLHQQLIGRITLSRFTHNHATPLERDGAHHFAALGTAPDRSSGRPLWQQVAFNFVHQLQPLAKEPGNRTAAHAMATRT